MITLDGKEDAEHDAEPTEVSLDIRASYPYQLQRPTNIPGHNATVEENIVMGLVEQKNRYIDEATKVAANYQRASAKLFLLSNFFTHLCMMIFSQMFSN